MSLADFLSDAHAVHFIGTAICSVLCVHVLWRKRNLGRVDSAARLMREEQKYELLKAEKALHDRVARACERADEDHQEFKERLDALEARFGGGPYR